MTRAQTKSWIFSTNALATSTKPTNINGASTVADGINHTISTQKECQTSISWLMAQGPIPKQGKNYELTIKAKLNMKKRQKTLNY